MPDAAEGAGFGSATISAELGQWAVLAETLDGWKATAAVYADPNLLRQLTGPLNDDFGPVPGPMEEDSAAVSANF